VGQGHEPRSGNAEWQGQFAGVDLAIAGDGADMGMKRLSMRPDFYVPVQYFFNCVPVE